MKKIIIITAIFLFAISAHAQRTSRGATRHEPEKQKSETAVRRSAEQKQSSSQQTTRTMRAPSQDISHTSTARSHANRPSGVSRSRTIKSIYEKPPQGKVSPNKGATGRYNGNVQSNNNTQRNNQSIRGNAAYRQHYATPNRRAVRTNQVKNHHYNPVRYRTVNYHYRVPKPIHVTWTNRMYRDYRVMYPEFGYWYYPIGYRILTIPSYHAYFNIGEVRNVYGRVHEVYYSWTTDEYHLYFGGSYPYHDFTVIIPGWQARRYDRYPESYFEGRYIWVTGLLSTFEGRPELIVKRRSQIHLY
jgi:hypothetical protein